MNKSELLELKEKIDTAKISIAELQGQQKANLATLKDKFNCNSIEEAESKLESLEVKKTELSEKLEAEITELETQIDELDIEI